MDRITYQSYRRFPDEALGSLMSHFLFACEGAAPDHFYGSIRRKPDGSCPFFGEDRLCSIQKCYGAELLTSSCSIYPRSLAVVGGVLEGSLSLSCPEAARFVLLQERSTETTSNLRSGKFRTDNVFGVREHRGLEAIFLPVRALIVDVLRDRSRPVWQRLLVIAALCRRLDGVGDYDLVTAAELLARCREVVGEGRSAELDQLPSDVASRLQMTIALSNRRCQDSDCGRRFQNVFWDFIEGIGSASSEGADEDVRRFRDASQRFFEPLMSEFPHILENYLINYAFQHLFPFGRTGSARLVAHTMFAEVLLLIVQYSWLTTLLTGVASRHGGAFSREHVVATVQAFTRAVEHAPRIMEEALHLVRSRDLDTMAGLAKLVRA